MSIKSLKRLNKEIKKCKKCPQLNIKGITESVPSYGDINSNIILIGQSPCSKDIKTQFPFSGKTGKFLEQIFSEIKIKKSALFVTNVLHCHPPHNRPSKPFEIENCRDFLKKEIEIVNPQLIITLGKDASQWFLGKIKLNEVTYKLTKWNNYCLLFPMYHPSFIIKQKSEVKKEFKEKLRDIINQWYKK